MALVVLFVASLVGGDVALPENITTAGIGTERQQGR